MIGRFGIALSVLLGGAFLSLVTAKEAQAEFVSRSACSVANPPANCQQLYASTVTQVVGSTEKRVRGTPKAGECEHPLIGELDYSNLVAEGVKSLSSTGKLVNFTGDVASMIHKDSLKFLQSFVGGDLGKALNRNFEGTQTVAVCAPLMVMLPTNATVVGFRLEAGDYGQPLKPCGAASACSIGWSAFYDTPHEVKSGGGRAYVATFSNWNHDGSRKVALTIFFSNPEQPVTEM